MGMRYASDLSFGVDEHRGEPAIVGLAGAGGLGHKNVRHVGQGTPQKFHPHGVGGHRVGCDDQGAGVLQIGQGAAGGAVGHHAHRAVQDAQGGLEQLGQLGDDAVDVLVEHVAPPPQKAIVILEGHGGPGALMVLDRGDHNDLGHAREGPGHDRPILEAVSYTHLTLPTIYSV